MTAAEACRLVLDLTRQLRDANAEIHECRALMEGYRLGTRVALQYASEQQRQINRLTARTRELVDELRQHRGFPTGDQHADRAVLDEDFNAGKAA